MSTEQELAALRELAKPILNNDGLNNCLKMGCEKCTYHRDGSCNSKDVVDAVKKYREVMNGKK